MSRSRKKRNKPYQGQDAAPSQPVVHRYTAPVRSPRQEWWHERKSRVILIAKVGGVSAVVAWLLFEAFQLAF